MDSTALAPRMLDLRTLLARINARIVLVRRWLSHDHRDEPFWWARRTTVPDAQRERTQLRALADLLHVARATERGRLHGTRFVDLDAQRAWLAELEQHTWRLAGLPDGTTLARLRAGELRW